MVIQINPKYYRTNAQKIHLTCAVSDLMTSFAALHFAVSSSAIAIASFSCLVVLSRSTSWSWALRLRFSTCKIKIGQEYWKNMEPSNHNLLGHWKWNWSYCKLGFQLQYLYLNKRIKSFLYANGHFITISKSNLLFQFVQFQLFNFFQHSVCEDVH